MKNIESYFADCDSRYDASLGMLGQVFTSPGYHTRLASGAWVHPTVHSLEYAVLLLRHGPTELHGRAEEIFFPVYTSAADEHRTLRVSADRPSPYV